MILGSFPRARFAHLPTPLEQLERMSAHLGIDLWVKRDDCTGLATGGNKTRKLEYLAGDALAEGADTLVTVGAIQSNHVRQTSAAAARLGLRCVAVLEDRVDRKTESYLGSGNRLLDDLFGAEVIEVAEGEGVSTMTETARRLRSEGKAPYVIPGGGSSAVGALGYVHCALETLHQSAERQLSIDVVVHATGSTGTQAGLVAGFAAMGAQVMVTGVSVDEPASVYSPRVHALAEETLERLGVGRLLGPEAVAVDDRFIGGGYGVPTDEMKTALSLVAHEEGLLLDPVYTGKAMAGLLAAVNEGSIEQGARVVFLHTGGAPGVFAYADMWRDDLSESRVKS